MARTTIGGNVTVDEANGYITRHIETYFDQDKFPVKSFIFDAALLRSYLNDNPSLENMKFMLGVRTDQTGVDTPTMIITGYDVAGNYIKVADNMVLDHVGACPYNCPTIGPAQNDLIS